MTSTASDVSQAEAWLPPRDLWPARVYRLPEFARYPDRLNTTEELLDRQIESGFANSSAVLFEDTVVTYQELLGQTCRFGNALRRLGIRPGERVMLRSLNEPAALTANFGVLRLGGIVVPTSPLLTAEQIAHIANDCAAAAIVVCAPLAAAVLEALPRMPTVRRVIMFDGGPTHDIPGVLRYESICAAETAELAPVRGPRTAVSVLLYSSGITEPARATAHFAEELLIIPDTYGRHGWRVRSDDVIAAGAPMSFAGGYSTMATIPFRFGATAAVIPLGRSTPSAMFGLIEKYRITLIAGMPTGYQRMAEVPDADPNTLRSLRVAAGGGEPLTARTYQLFKDRFGIEIYEGFGTNGMMYVFITNAVTGRVRPGSVGTPLPGYEVKAITDTGATSEPGEIGQLCVRGPVGTVYWGPPETAELIRRKQRQAVRGGWVFVGDYVAIDADGYVTFVARDEDLITVDGHRFGPGVVEDALLDHPAVAEAGVIGMADGHGAQRVRAYVVLQPGQPAGPELAEELRETCRYRLAAAEVPTDVEFVDSLPRSMFGTLLRRILWADWFAERGAGVS